MNLADATCLNDNRARWTFTMSPSGVVRGTRLGIPGQPYGFSDTGRTFTDVRDLDRYLRWCVAHGWSVRRQRSLQDLLR